MRARRSYFLFLMHSISAVGLSAVLMLAISANPATAGDGDIFLDGGGGDYQVHKVKSLLDLRFHNIVRQHADFSCGSAAIATLLTYHYGHPIDETDVLRAMYENGDQNKIRTQGFSLLDMKHYLESIGYHAAGYREPLDKLTNVGIPAIALINKHGYMHFVVIQGVNKDKVAIGDPTLGLRIYTREDFEKMWNGIIFVVLDSKDIAKASFNTAEDWSPNGHPHFRNMLDLGELGNMTINSVIMPNYY